MSTRRKKLLAIFGISVALAPVELVTHTPLWAAALIGGAIGVFVAEWWPS